MIGNKYRLWNGTEVQIVGVIGGYYRVKNLNAGHTTSYLFQDFDQLKKERILTTTDILKTYKKCLE